MIFFVHTFIINYFYYTPYMFYNDPSLITIHQKFKNVNFAKLNFFFFSKIDFFVISNLVVVKIDCSAVV